MTQFNGNGRPNCKLKSHDKIHSTKNFKEKIQQALSEINKKYIRDENYKTKQIFVKYETES